MTAETMTAEQLAELLAAVRNHLDITWADPALDDKLKGFLRRGVSRINDLAGAEQSFAEGTLARDLLFERCRFFRANAGEQFEKSYQAEIVSLRLMQGVARYEADNPDI